ncbi:MAG: hypothetical protein ACREDZ_10020 [Kiloniellales bacterium]
MRLSKNAVRIAVRRHPLVHRLTVVARERGLFVKPDGVQGVACYGHRSCVGGDWQKHGQYQFDFMRSQGLTPSDVLFDIGCGSLRGGVRFIPFLEAGNYLGMEKEAELLRAGIERELDAGLMEDKKPELVVSDSFEFHKIGKDATYAFAGSVFSHLTADHIRLCLGNLREKAQVDCKFFATYFEADKKRVNYSKSHAHYSFYYTRSEMEEMGRQNGWSPTYLGDWAHPGAVTQKVMRYTAS